MACICRRKQRSVTPLSARLDTSQLAKIRRNLNASFHSGQLTLLPDAFRGSGSLQRLTRTIMAITAAIASEAALTISMLGGLAERSRRIAFRALNGAICSPINMQRPRYSCGASGFLNSRIS